MKRALPLCEPIAGVLLALVIFGGLLSAMVLSIPLYAIWTYHRRKMEEIRGGQRAKLDQAAFQAIEDVRREVRDLRDTATAYDVSFDTALKRIDDRVASVEQRIQQAEQQNSASLRQTL